jgi:hypothetical protein
MDMSTTTRQPTGIDVVCRVWLGGLAWGPATAAAVVLSWGLWWWGVGVVTGRFDVADLVGVTSGVLVVSFIAVPIGLLVGLVAGLVAGLLLAAARPLGSAAPWLVWVTTLAGLALTCRSFTGPDLEATLVLTVPVCVLSAWPVLHTLRKALRPTTARR